MFANRQIIALAQSVALSASAFSGLTSISASAFATVPAPIVRKVDDVPDLLFPIPQSQPEIQRDFALAVTPENYQRDVLQLRLADGGKFHFAFLFTAKESGEGKVLTQDFLMSVANNADVTRLSDRLTSLGFSVRAASSTETEQVLPYASGRPHSEVIFETTVSTVKEIAEASLILGGVSVVMFLLGRKSRENRANVLTEEPK